MREQREREGERETLSLSLNDLVKKATGPCQFLVKNTIKQKERGGMSVAVGGRRERDDEGR